MNKKNYITIELALWLRDNGCKIKTEEAFYGNAGTWHDTIVQLEHYNGADEDFHKHKLLPTYTYYDIIMTYAEEFFGGINYEGEALQVFLFLQEGRRAEAEVWIKNRCVFGKKRYVI